MIGRLSFVDTPTIYEKGANVVGKVGKHGVFVVHIYIAGELKRPLVTPLSPSKQIKAVYYNGTAMAGEVLHLFKGQRWSQELFQNVTIDSAGMAVFTLCTKDLEENIFLEVWEKTQQKQQLPSQNPHTNLTMMCLRETSRSCCCFSSCPIQVSTSPTKEYPGYRTPHILDADHTLSLAQEATSESKTSSTFEVKGKDKPLACDTEEEITVKYTIVGETKGPLDLYYYVSKGWTMTGNLLLTNETTVSYHDNNDK